KCLLLGPFSGYPNLIGQTDNLHVIYYLMWGTIDPTTSWIGAGVAVAGLGALIWWSDSRRRGSGLVAPPASISLIKIGVVAVVAIVVVAICNVNRANLGTLEGVPWVIPIVLAVLAAWTILLQRTKYGRYGYAIGGNAEAARRAGINGSLIRTIAFAPCWMTPGIGDGLYAAYVRGNAEPALCGPP